MVVPEQRKPGLRLCAVRVCIAALFVCHAVAAADRTPATGLRTTKAAEIERVVEAEMARLKIPGLTVAVGEDLRLAWARGFGLADVEGHVAAGPETVYRIASLSKPITAVAVMQLAEKGKLDLDSPIQSYVPSFPRKRWPVTVRELLAHMAGIRHYRSMAEVNSTQHYTDLADTLKIFEDAPLLFEPGTQFLYSTYGYNLLGAAVEQVSARRFVEYLREHIFVPAHMEYTRDDNVYAVIPNRARGYRLGPEGLENCALSDTSNKTPGGGLLSTAGDLVQFVAALERGDLLNARSRAEMFTPVRIRNGRTVAYGLGWSILDQHRRWVGHSGAQPGTSTFLLTSVPDGMSVAVLANLEGLDLQAVTARIAGIVLSGN